MKITKKLGCLMLLSIMLLAVACIKKPETTELPDNSTIPLADLGNGYFRNPVLVGTRADNTITRVGNDYYMVAGGQSVWHSRDMVNWVPLSPTLNTFRDGIWASDIIHHNGRYYVYTTEVNMSRGNVGQLNMAQRSLLGVPFKDQGDKAWSNVVIWAYDPGGPWSEPIELGVYGVFDPGHIVDLDGNRYLFFNLGMMIKLTPDGLSVEGDLMTVYDGWDVPEGWVMECKCLEAPKLIHLNDYYYMASAQGGTGGPKIAHMGIIARAKLLEGPWENSPYNPIVRTWDQNEKWVRQGHGTLIDDIEGNWWFMYTGYEKRYETLGKQSLLLPVEWTEDGWPVIADGVNVCDDIKKPAGENIGHGIPVSDDFTSEKLESNWNAGNGIDMNTEFEFGNGFLKMPAKGEIPGESAIQPINASILTVTQFHHAYEVEVEIEIPETAEGGILISTRAGHFSTANTRNAFTTTGIRKGELFATWGGVANYIDWDESHIFVKIRNMNSDVSCFYSTDGNNWTMFKNSTSVTNANNISLYAAGEGDVIFKNFKFRGLNKK